MTTSTPPSKTSVTAILREASWDPRAQGMMKPMAEMPSSYLLSHATVLLQQSTRMGTCDARATQIKAMGLIALAIDKDDRASSPGAASSDSA